METQGKPGFVRWIVSWVARLAIPALLVGCPSNDMDFGPLTVETSIAAADLDGDGLQDVVTVAMHDSGSAAGDRYGVLKVYLQTDAGSFASPAEVRVGSYPWLVKIGDVDGDSAPDLVVLDVEGYSGQRGVVYLLLQDRNNPGRFLAPQVIVTTAVQFYDFALADLNGDDALDLVLADGIGGGNGAQAVYQRVSQRGSFDAPVAIALPGRASHVAAGYLNDDDLVDLAFYATTGFNVNTGATGNAMLVYGLPGGGFSSATVLAPQIGLNAKLVEIADVDGNGLNDVLIVFTPFSTDYRAKLTVLLQMTAENFATVDSSLAGLQGIDGFVAANLNGDIYPDVATAGFFPTGSPTTVRSHANVLVPTGSGSYGLAAVYELGVTISRITAADLDGDGRNDLVLLGGDDLAYVMLQSAGAPGSFLPARPL
jgi:hypothetical protein